MTLLGVGMFHSIRRFLVALSFGWAVAASAQAQTVPTIKKVLFKTGNDGLTAKIIGTNFGASPVTLPCKRCLISQLHWGAFPNSPEAVDIRNWTDTEVELTHLKDEPGNTILLSVENDALGTTVAGAANVPGGPAPPVIQHMKISRSGKHLRIVLTGNGFGAAPPGVPGKTDIPYFQLLVWVTGGQAPDYPFSAGNGGNLVTLNYVSWTSTRIEINGFSGYYGHYGWTVASGDAVAAALFNVPVGGGYGPSTGKAGRVP